MIYGLSRPFNKKFCSYAKDQIILFPSIEVMKSYAMEIENQKEKDSETGEVPDIQLYKKQLYNFDLYETHDQVCDLSVFVLPLFQFILHSFILFSMREYKKLCLQKDDWTVFFIIKFDKVLFLG